MRTHPAHSGRALSAKPYRPMYSLTGASVVAIIVALLGLLVR